MSNNNIEPQLSDILGDPARVLTGNAIEEKYYSFTHGRERGHADALVFPESTEEVSRVLRFAYENNIHVTPRGAGTNLTGSTVPLYGGIVLDLSRMNHILEIDEETLTAVVEPGVILEDFQNEVEARGLFYPPDPGEKKASLGGNISTNAGGMRAVRYGVTRDYVRGLEVVLSDGRVTTLGSKNVKDASGLSLKNLVIGSEGTLAVITKAILRLVPKPEASRSLIAAFPDTESGISAVPEILKANLDPTALEFVERKVAERGEAFTGCELVHDTHRLALMNAMLHDMDGKITLGDTLSTVGQSMKNFDVVLTNPPFGTKKGGERATRDDFTFPTSNKQLNFLQHIYRSLKADGKARAAVVLPDNVLFADGDGEKIRVDLMDKCNLHTVLRLPTGIFYAQGVKTNVLFFTRGTSDKNNTKEVFFYDLRTNMPSFGKTHPLKKEDFAGFEAAYTAEDRHTVEDERWSCFSRAEIQEKGNSLDLGLIKDDSIVDYDDLPDPIESGEQAIADLEEAADLLRSVVEELKSLTPEEA